MKIGRPQVRASDGMFEFRVCFRTSCRGRLGGRGRLRRRCDRGRRDNRRADRLRGRVGADASRGRPGDRNPRALWPRGWDQGNTSMCGESIAEGGTIEHLAWPRALSIMKRKGYWRSSGRTRCRRRSGCGRCGIGSRRGWGSRSRVVCRRRWGCLD